jgi:hypothetical protein
MPEYVPALPVRMPEPGPARKAREFPAEAVASASLRSTARIRFQNLRNDPVAMNRLAETIDRIGTIVKDMDNPNTKIAIMLLLTSYDVFMEVMEPGIERARRWHRDVMEKVVVDYFTARVRLSTGTVLRSHIVSSGHHDAWALAGQGHCRHRPIMVHCLGDGRYTLPRRRRHWHVRGPGVPRRRRLLHQGSEQL